MENVVLTLSVPKVLEEKNPEVIRLLRYMDGEDYFLCKRYKLMIFSMLKSDNMQFVCVDIVFFFNMSNFVGF